jgi:hypothetical protein
MEPKYYVYTYAESVFKNIYSVNCDALNNMGFC